MSGGGGELNSLTPFIYHFDRKGACSIYHPLKNGKSVSLNQKVFQSFWCNVNGLKWYGYNLWPSWILNRFSYTFKYLKSWIPYPLIHLKPTPKYPFWALKQRLLSALFHPLHTLSVEGQGFPLQYDMTWSVASRKESQELALTVKGILAALVNCEKRYKHGLQYYLKWECVLAPHACSHDIL